MSAGMPATSVLSSTSLRSLRSVNDVENLPADLLLHSHPLLSAADSQRAGKSQRMACRCRISDAVLPPACRLACPHTADIWCVFLLATASANSQRVVVFTSCRSASLAAQSRLAVLQHLR